MIRMMRMDSGYGRWSTGGRRETGVGKRNRYCGMGGMGMGGMKKGEENCTRYAKMLIGIGDWRNID